MTMRRNEARFTWCLAILIALAGATLMTAAPARAGSKVVAGASNFNVHAHFGMHPRIAVHPGFGTASPRGFGILPPLGPGIVPPFGPGIVPPLVSGQDRFHRRRIRQFPFLPFGLGFGVGNDIFIGGMPDPAALSAQMAAAPKLPPPQPDFEPHVISLKPNAPTAGDPRSVVILRPGQPDEVVWFGDGAR